MKFYENRLSCLKVTEKWRFRETRVHWAFNVSTNTTVNEIAYLMFGYQLFECYLTDIITGSTHIHTYRDMERKCLNAHSSSR